MRPMTNERMGSLAWIAVSFVLAMIPATVVAAEKAARPNIIFIMADDLGFADTQVHNPDTPTPQIGELAREGLVLMNLHTYLYCSPTR